MATIIGVAKAAGATVTEPAHAAGDILFLFATRDGNAAAPTSPGGAGYSAWWDNTVNTYGGIFSIKQGTGTPVSVTATNATAVMIVAVRGIQNPNTYTPTIASNRLTGSSTTASNVSLTLASTASSVLAFKATRESASTASAETVPAGMTFVDSVGVNEELAVFFADAVGTTSWAPASQTISTTATGWITVAYELVNTSASDTITVTNGSGSIAGQTITDGDAGGSDTVTVTPGAAAVAGQTVWLHVVDNPYPDQPVLTGTPPSGFTWPQDVVGLFETTDGKIAFGQRSDSAVTGDYLDLATHNGDQSWSFKSDGKYAKMEVRSGDQYYEDDSTKERSELGTMRLYSPTNTKYVFEWNSLFDGTANPSSAWCTLAQWHPDSGGSPIIGIYWEGTTLVLITRSGTPGSPTETYRMSLAGSGSPALTYGIYHRFTLTIDWSGGISNAALKLDIDGVNRVNVSGVTIGHTTTTSFRHYWGVYRAEAPETTSHQVKNIQVTVGDAATVDNPGNATAVGQDITVTDTAGGTTETIVVDPGAASLDGQTVLETDTIPLTEGAAALAGQTITVLEADTDPITFGGGIIQGGDIVEIETIPVDPTPFGLVGQDVATPLDSGPTSDVVVVDAGSLSLAGGDVTDFEVIPPQVVPSSGGGGGPSSDEAYYGTRRRQEAEREAEERRWKGKPATRVADKPSKPPKAPAEVKKSITPVVEDDPVALLLAELLAPMPLRTPLPAPTAVFDPEDDVAVLLLLAGL